MVDMASTCDLYKALADRGFFEVTSPLYEKIIKESQNNPWREFFPSIDLGAGDDFAHGLLLGSKQHFMVDTTYENRTSEFAARIADHLHEAGIQYLDVRNRASESTIEYLVGDEKRRLTLLARDVDRAFADARLLHGFSTAMMKGQGGYSCLEGILPIYQDGVKRGGLYLSASSEPRIPSFQKIASGPLGFETASGDTRVQEHVLYRKK